MSYDFDTVYERRGTDSQKWQKYAGRDVLPLWVADMDFKSAPAIIEALQRRVEHGIFGRGGGGAFEAVIVAVTWVFSFTMLRFGWTHRGELLGSDSGRPTNAP